jgi:asparagine synthase (glutamine-hydrolysing)
VWQYDDLCADPASLPMYLIAQKAREHVKVVLSGEGADEIFGGYERAFILRWAWALSNKVPSSVLMVLPKVLRAIPPQWGNLVFRYFSILAPEGIDRLQTFLGDLQSPHKAYQAIQAVLMPTEANSLLLPEHTKGIGPDSIAESIVKPWFPHSPGNDSVRDAMRFEMGHRLVNELLLKCDAMTMAHSLECRVPFLDHRLVEYALRIPIRQNLGLGSGKTALRRALAPMLPKRVANAPKEGFFVPIHNWLEAMRPWMQELLDEKKLASQGIFDPKKVAQMMDRFSAGKLYHARGLWNLMNYQIWHNIYIENGGAQPE